LDLRHWKYRTIALWITFFISLSASGAQEPALTETDLTTALQNPLAPVQGQGELWERACVDENDLSTCRIVQNLFVEREVDGKTERLGRVLQITVIYSGHPETGERVPYISMNLPLGVDLRPGAVVKVDSGVEIALPYLQCVNDGCAISAVLDDTLLSQLQQGQQLLVGFRAWGNTDTTVIPASLIGFTKAFNTLQ